MDIASALEAILFAAGEPVPAARLSLVLETDEEEILRTAEELAETYRREERGMRILRLDGKLQMCSAPEYAPLITKTLEQRKPPMLSQPALETLAIVAYFQPVTRAYIDRVRGVDSSYTVSVLNERGLIESMNTPSGRKRRIKSVTRKLDTGFISHARQADAMRQVLDDSPGDVLVMGDLNDTPGSFAYRTVCGTDLHDAWAETGLGPTYTFNSHHLYVKIDHILYRGRLKPMWCHRVKAGESDHYPLVAVFERY